MSSNDLIPGCILHWEGFKFEDGSEKDKYLVLVGANENKDFLAILTTSQQWKRKRELGGNAEGGWYFIQGGGKDWFQKDTWLLFDAPVQLSSAEFLKAVLEKKVTVKGHLRAQIANEICNCMKRCEDVSQIHKDLLGPPRK